MGFTTGFIGGLTATYTLLYMSLHLHRSNRQHQSLLLTQQRSLLSTIYAPETIIVETPAYEVRKAGIAEELKDRWNRELSQLVHNLQETDWDAVRVRFEQRAANLWDNVRRTEVGKEVGQRLSENVIGTAEGVKEGAKEVADSTTTGKKRLLEVN